MTASPKPRGAAPPAPPVYMHRRLGNSRSSVLVLPLVLVFSLLAIVYIQIENGDIGERAQLFSSDEGGTALSGSRENAEGETSGPHRALGSHKLISRQLINEEPAAKNTVRSGSSVLPVPKPRAEIADPHASKEIAVAGQRGSHAGDVSPKRLVSLAFNTAEKIRQAAGEFMCAHIRRRNDFERFCASLNTERASRYWRNKHARLSEQGYICFPGRETIRATLMLLLAQEHTPVAVILSDDPVAVLNLLHPTDERPGDDKELRNLELLSMEHVQALHSEYGAFENLSKSERTIVEQVLCSQARVVLLNAYSEFSTHIAKIAEAEKRGAVRASQQRIEYFRDLDLLAAPGGKPGVKPHKLGEQGMEGGGAGDAEGEGAGGSQHGAGAAGEGKVAGAAGGEHAVGSGRATGRVGGGAAEKGAKQGAAAGKAAVAKEAGGGGAGAGGGAHHAAPVTMAGRGGGRGGMR